MRDKKLTVLVIVLSMSIILLGTTRSTYLVEKTMEVFNFEFSSKEAYMLTVEIIRWVRWLYFGVLGFLTFYLFQRRRSCQ